MGQGFERALEVLERRRSELRSLLPAGTQIVDAHTHLGVDEDGHALTPEEHLDGMDRNGVARSFVFALNEPDRVPAYRAPNDRVLAWAGESGGRLVPFVRLSLDEEPLREAERCVERGARGIKLHPRAQAFRIDDARLEAVFAFASDRRLPVLIHAGRGLPAGMAAELAAVADRHPGASLILAHAAIAEQSRIGEFANGHPNIYFDTSAWSPLDILALFAKVGPEQVLYASDVPYGGHLAAQNVVVRLMRKLGLPADQQRAVLGGTAAALVEGRRPERISPPAAPDRFDVPYEGARVHNYLSAATPLLWFGQTDMIGFLGLAAGACAAGNGSMEGVAEAIAAAELVWLASVDADDPRESARLRRAAFNLLSFAQAEALFS